MTTLLSTISSNFDITPDPRVENWVLISSPRTFIVILLSYILVVKKIGPEYMKNRKPYDLKRVIQAYNIIQIIACSASVIALIKSGWFTTLTLRKCQPVDFSNDPNALYLLNVCWYSYLIKIFDLCDTVFFVLRKKYNQVSTLHVYHHAVILLFGWIGVKYLGGGSPTFWVLLNNVIHTLMYTYYLLSTFGPKWQQKLQPIKANLTMLQMVQFVLILGHSLFLLNPSCGIQNKLVLVLFMPNVATFLYLFNDFYKANYNKIKNKK